MRPGAGEQRGEIAGAGGPVDHDARPEQAHVADAVGDEGPQGGVDRVAPFVKEADEERRRDAEELPAREQDVDAAREHHQVHAGAEEGEQDEESREARLTVEVFPGEGVDQAAEAGGEADVGHREAVGDEVDGGGVVPDLEEPAEVHDLGRESAVGQHHQHREGGDEARRERRGDEPGRGPLGERPAEQRRQADGHEGRRRGDELPGDECRHGIGGEGVEDHRGSASRRPAGTPASRLAGGTLPRCPRYQATEDATVGIESDSGV